MLIWNPGSVTRSGDLLDFGQLLNALATLNLPKSLTFLRNFGKGVKIYHFSSKIILGNFYRHLAIFSGYTAHLIAYRYAAWLDNGIDFDVNVIVFRMGCFSIDYDIILGIIITLGIGITPGIGIQLYLNYRQNLTYVKQ